jgi:RimJ/RimL family protein N-acetyltransferase
MSNKDYGKGIRLRALTKKDAITTCSWRNNNEIRQFYSGHPFYVNIEKEEAWFDKILCLDIPLTSFGIEERKSNCLIGITFLKDINLINRTAEFAIFIGDDNARGKGYGREATINTIDFAFNQLNLNRVFLKVQENNQKALHLFENCGFIKEGLLRECTYKNGQYQNEVVMSVLKPEYIRMKQQII